MAPHGATRLLAIQWRSEDWRVHSGQYGAVANATDNFRTCAGWAAERIGAMMAAHRLERAFIATDLRFGSSGVAPLRWAHGAAHSPRVARRTRPRRLPRALRCARVRHDGRVAPGPRSSTCTCTCICSMPRGVRAVWRDVHGVRRWRNLYPPHSLCAPCLRVRARRHIPGGFGAAGGARHAVRSRADAAQRADARVHRCDPRQRCARPTRQPLARRTSMPAAPARPLCVAALPDRCSARVCTPIRPM
eukprot:3786663-Prymnesium_polylepis.1